MLRTALGHASSIDRRPRARQRLLRRARRVDPRPGQRSELVALLRPRHRGVRGPVLLVALIRFAAVYASLVMVVSGPLLSKRLAIVPNTEALIGHPYGRLVLKAARRQAGRIF